jgi:hypothetical protein
MSTQAEDTQDATAATHLVVICHGLWGNPVHLKHLKETLISHHASSGIYLFTPSSNRDNYTYDGIDCGAERITSEIEAKIKSLREEGAKLDKISVAGYSLGGLVARYVVGLLYKNGVFETLRPMNFTTFATPHLGVRTPKRGYRAQTWNFLGSKTLSTSGAQMFLSDDFRGTGRHLLSVMADPNSIFVRGLKLFERRSVYANTINDRSVPYYTSYITAHDPYINLDDIEVHPLPGQEQPVVLDPSNPVTPREKPVEKNLSWQERYIISRKTRETLPFYAFMFTFIPLAVPLFMLNAGYQTYVSAQRIRLHEEGKAIDLKRYRIPLLEDAQGVQDRLMERLATERTHVNEESAAGYLPTPPPEPATATTASSASSTSSDKLTSEKKVVKADGSSWPTLALTDAQFEMIENLDQHINFTKYACHIQKVQHTHAAIVVRMPKESFGEGKAVSGHWAKEFLV